MYQICNNCVMDTTAPKITFDNSGICEYCNNYYDKILPNWHPNQHGVKLFAPILKKIKKEGNNKKHNCLIGISGGADSSYLVHLAKTKFDLIIGFKDDRLNSQLQRVAKKTIKELLSAYHCLDNELDTKVVAFDSNKTQADIIYHEKIKDTVSKSDNFKHKYIFQNAP